MSIIKVEMAPVPTEKLGILFVTGGKCFLCRPNGVGPWDLAGAQLHGYRNVLSPVVVAAASNWGLTCNVGEIHHMGSFSIGGIPLSLVWAEISCLKQGRSGELKTLSLASATRGFISASVRQAVGSYCQMRGLTLKALPKRVRRGTSSKAVPVAA